MASISTARGASTIHSWKPRSFTGWLTAGQDRQLAFSFVVNGIASEAEGKALEDKVAGVLASYPEAPAPAVRRTPFSTRSP